MEEQYVIPTLHRSMITGMTVMTYPGLTEIYYIPNITFINNKRNDNNDLILCVGSTRHRNITSVYDERNENNDLTWSGGRICYFQCYIWLR